MYFESTVAASQASCSLDYTNMDELALILIPRLADNKTYHAESGSQSYRQKKFSDTMIFQLLQ